MCKDIMPVSVKVYYGSPSAAVSEIRRFTFRPEQHKSGSGIYHALLERIRALFNGLNLRDVHLCWKDDDSDYVVFSSDDELRVAITNTTDNTLRIYIREKELPVRVVGASGSSSSGVVVGNNATGSVALATGPSTSRRSEQQQQAAQERQSHHRHHYHTSAGHVRRSTRSESSPRADVTPTTGTIRHHRSTGPGDHLSKDMSDHLHIDDEVLMVAVDHQPPPSSPNMATTNHIGERHGGHRSTGTIGEDHIVRDACTGSAAITAASTAISSGTTAILCSECRGEGRGVWYRCTVCADFYLCSECENRGLHDQHIMVRISSAASGGGGAGGGVVGSRHGTPNYYHR